MVGMHATVLYRRDCLLAVNGFDETLRRLEDHDIYLRIAHNSRSRAIRKSSLNTENTARICPIILSSSLKWRLKFLIDMRHVSAPTPERMRPSGRVEQ